MTSEDHIKLMVDAHRRGASAEFLSEVTGRGVKSIKYWVRKYKGKKVDVKEVEPHPHHYRIEMPNGALATGICKICFHIKPHFNSSDFVFNNKKMETGRNIAPLRINGHS